MSSLKSQLFKQTQTRLLTAFNLFSLCLQLYNYIAPASLIGNVLLRKFSDSKFSEEGDDTVALSSASDAPPAVPKVSLHEDARSEVLHVWREWRHRQMLKQFKEAVSKSSEESEHSRIWKAL